MAEQKEPATILVVDDSFTNRVLLNKIFSAEYRVEQASDGVEALEMLQRLTDVAAVVLDLQMPRLDGYGVLDAMRADERLKDIPVVVDTGSDDVQSQLKALDCGAVDVLIKPFNPQIALHRIRNIITRREADRQAARNKTLEELLRQSEIDEKTGIYNKHAFCRRTTELLRENPHREFVLLRWDVDRFKVFNDVFGVAAGDEFLRTIGTAYRRAADDNIRYGHWEADHFVTCMPKEYFEAYRVAERISQVVAGLHSDFEFVARLGVYPVDDPELDVALMCDRALLALRSIKDSYSTRVAYYDESMRAVLLEEQEIIGDMDRALEQGQFIVYLQPQYNYAERALHGAEALVRWAHPERGLIPPDQFIPVFERNGFISRVDEYVWEEVCRLQRKWLDAGERTVPISVNISRRDSYNPHLCEIIENLVQKYDIPHRLLRLEITESAYMENAEQLIGTVEKLRKAGFAVEMDDFGSGYSSLNTLKEVPVDMLKLDMRFLEDSAGETRGGSILTSVIRMSHWIKLPVIAEGVETKEQAEYLKSIGCLYMQGYYFAKPMPVKDFEALLRDRRVDRARDRRFDGDVLAAADFLSASAQTTLLFNSFLGGASIIEYDGNNVEALRLNDKYYEVLGTTREAYAGKQLKMLERFDAENRARYLAAIQQAIETGEESNCELCSLPLTEGGREFWTQTRMRLLAQNENRYILYCAVENITDRMNMTEQLKVIMDSVPGGILDFELTDSIRTVYYNDMAAMMFGYTREQYGRLFADEPLLVVHPDDLPAFRQEIQAVLGGGRQTLEAAYRHRCADGSWRWVRLTGRIVRRKEGTTFASGILLDIDSEVKTEQVARKQAEEIERQRVSLQTLYDTIPCGIMQFAVTADGDGRSGLVSFNDTAWRIYGYESRMQYVEAVHDKSKLKDVYAEDLPVLKRCIAAVRGGEAGKQADCDHRILRPDGSIRWVRALFQKMRYVDGEEAIQVVFSDVTERKQADLQRLSSALFGLYDEIFELDVDQNTSYMRTAKRADDPRIGRYVSMDKMLDVLCNEYAYPEDRERIRAFYAAIGQQSEEAPATLEFRYTDAQGRHRWASLTVVHLSGSVYLTCNRDITDQKNAERLAKENELLQALANERKTEAERNRIFIQSTGILMYDYDPATDIMRLQHRDAVQGVVEETLEHYLADYHKKTAITREDRDRMREILEEMLLAPDHKTVEYRSTRMANGSSRRRRTEVVSIADETGKVYRVIGQVGEVQQDSTLTAVPTANAEALAEYESNLDRYARTLFGLFDEIFELDLRSNTFLPLSSKCRSGQIGASRGRLDQAIERWSSHFVHEEDRAAFKAFLNPQAVRLAFQNGGAPTLEYAVELPDQTTCFCKSTLLQLDADRYLCCNKDVTEQKRAEQLKQEVLQLKARADEQDRYRIVVEQTGTAVIDMNYETGECACSAAYEKYEGSRYSQQEMFDNTGDRRLVHPDDQVALDAFFAATSSGGTHAETVLRLKMADGSYRWTRMAGTFLQNAEGKRVRSIGTFTDIDEEMRSKLELEALSERMRRIIANIPTGVAIYEMGEQIMPVYVSDKTCEMFGFTRAEYDLCIANGEPIRFMPDASVLSPDSLRKLRSGQPVVIQKMHATRKDGSRFWLRAFCSMGNGRDGTPLCYAVLADITEEVALEQKYMWQAEKYKILSESADMITFDYSPADDVMRMSIPLSGGGAAEEVRERYLETFDSFGRIADTEKDRFIETLRRAAQTPMRGTYDFEGDYYRTGMRWYRAKYVSLADTDGQVYRVIGRLDDITDIMREQDQLRVDAQLDEVTGIYNKNYAIAAIAETQRNRRADSMDALLFMDIDNFKGINDTFGHPKADKVLRRIGDVLQKLFRREDLVARFGGDEFIVYMRSIGSIKDATEKAEAILRAVNEIAIDGKNVVSCSIGVTGIMGKDDADDGALTRADKALYRAKADGKNRYAVWE